MDTAAPISATTAPPPIAPSPDSEAVTQRVASVSFRLRQNILNMPRTSVVIAALAGIGLYAVLIGLNDRHRRVLNES